MISNERQAGIARARLRELLKAAELADERAESVEAEVLRSLRDEVQSELDEYLDIREGRVSAFTVKSLDEVGEAAVKARISRGWTQKQLAEAQDVSEQMVQKDEATEYEAAGIARVAEVLDALDFELVGCVRHKQEPAYWAHGGRQYSASAGVESVGSSLTVFGLNGGPALLGGPSGDIIASSYSHGVTYMGHLSLRSGGGTQALSNTETIDRRVSHED